MSPILMGLIIGSIVGSLFAALVGLGGLPSSRDSDNIRPLPINWLMILVTAAISGAVGGAIGAVVGFALQLVFLT